MAIVWEKDEDDLNPHQVYDLARVMSLCYV